MPLFDSIAWRLQKRATGWIQTLQYTGTPVLPTEPPGHISTVFWITLAGCDGCVRKSCTILIMDAGIRGALTLRLVLWGLWVDDGRVSLLEHLLHEGVCAHVVITVWPTILLHCEGTSTHWIRVMIEAADEHVFSIDGGCTYETLTFVYEM